MSETEKIYISIRRQKVLALLVKGWTHKRIAGELKVNVKTIQRDIKWLKTKRIDIDLIRAFNWTEIFRILPKLTPLQQAKIHIGILKILEPTKVDVSGDIGIEAQVERLHKAANKRFVDNIREGMSALSPGEFKEFVCILKKMGIDVDIHERVLTTS